MRCAIKIFLVNMHHRVRENWSGKMKKKCTSRGRQRIVDLSTMEEEEEEEEDEEGKILIVH